MKAILINTKKNYGWKLFISSVMLFLILTNIINTNEILRITRPLIRGLEHKVVSLHITNFDELETENFIIRYQDVDEDEDILDLVAVTAESKYLQTTKIFNYEPSNKITIILYGQPEPMMKATTLRKGTPPMGVYYGGSLHILDPTHWIQDETRFNETFYSEGPILHELVHLFTDHLAQGNFPVWFTEGVSLYLEYEVDGYQWGKEVEFREGEYTLTQLTDSFNQMNQYLAYTKSFRIIKGFVEDNGIDALIQLINELGEGRQLKNYYYLFDEK